MTTTRLSEQPSRKDIIAIANLVFISGIVISSLIVFYCAYRVVDWWGIQQTPRLYVIGFISSVISTLLCSLALRLRDSVKVNAALVIFSSFISLILAETYLTFKLPPSFPEQILTVELRDPRSKIQIIDDLRLRGIDAYPNVSGSQFILTDGLPNPPSSQRIFPLGTISNKTTVSCNESGQWAIYESDEHGFNNPHGLYVENSVEMMLTGDSFAEGACVNADESIASILRESGLNVISLGKGGNGSLLEFASFKEYAVPLKPKVLLWIHYANDISDLKWKGTQSSFLMNYLTDDDFSQHLMSRQNEIDDVLKHYVNRKYQEHKITTERSNAAKTQQTVLDKEEGKESNVLAPKGKGNKPTESSLSRLIKILKLTNFRVKLGLRGGSPSLFSPASTSKIETPPAIPDADRADFSALSEFRELLRKASEDVSKWDGKFYLVYLHTFERYSTGKEWQGYFRKHVLRIASELNIPVIDAHKEVFASHSDPLSLFPGRKARHYNAKGYRLVAEAIARRLRNDGLFP